MDIPQTIRVPFQSATHLNSKQKKPSSHKQQKADPQQVEQMKASQTTERSHYEIMEKPQLVQLVIMQQRVLSSCFDENDQLRERISKVEALYSAAQDEIELRDKAIEELSKLLETE